jgi:hypothetical protein
MGIDKATTLALLPPTLSTAGAASLITLLLAQINDTADWPATTCGPSDRHQQVKKRQEYVLGCKGSARRRLMQVISDLRPCYMHQETQRQSGLAESRRGCEDETCNCVQNPIHQVVCPPGLPDLLKGIHSSISAHGSMADVLVLGYGPSRFFPHGETAGLAGRLAQGAGAQIVSCFRTG